MSISPISLLETQQNESVSGTNNANSPPFFDNLLKALDEPEVQTKDEKLEEESAYLCAALPIIPQIPVIVTPPETIDSDAQLEGTPAIAEIQTDMPVQQVSVDLAETLDIPSDIQKDISEAVESEKMSEIFENTSSSKSISEKTVAASNTQPALETVNLPETATISETSENVETNTELPVIPIETDRTSETDVQSDADQADSDTFQNDEKSSSRQEITAQIKNLQAIFNTEFLSKTRFNLNNAEQYINSINARIIEDIRMTSLLSTPQHIRIDLDPEFLGKLSIDLTKTSSGRIETKITVTSQSTGDAITNHIAELYAALRSHGVDVRNIDVAMEKQQDSQEPRENSNDSQNPKENHENPRRDRQNHDHDYSAVLRNLLHSEPQDAPQ